MAEPVSVASPVDAGSIDRDGVEISYAVYGDGPTTLLLMPTWTIVHSRIWKGQLGYLARHYRVVVFDQLGSGRSDKPKDKSLWNIPRFIEEVEAVRTTLGLGRVHLLGQSWGTWLGTDIAWLISTTSRLTSSPTAQAAYRRPSPR